MRHDSLPSGLVTFLFTDIEGSTRLAHALGPGYRAVLTEHRRLLRRCLGESAGAELLTEGDSFFAVFAEAADAVRACVQAQRALAAHPWPGPGLRPRVRMGLHTGHAVAADGEYASLEVHRAARVAAAAAGDQVLCTAATAQRAGDVDLVDLGLHRLRGFDDHTRLYQIVAPGLAPEFPRPKTVDDRCHNLPEPLTRFIGRARDRAELAALIRRHRLVTVWGTGGVGKTRLAVEVARDLLRPVQPVPTHAPPGTVDRLADGAWLADLAGLGDIAAWTGAAARPRQPAATRSGRPDVPADHGHHGDNVGRADVVRGGIGAGHVIGGDTVGGDTVRGDAVRGAAAGRSVDAVAGAVVTALGLRPGAGQGPVEVLIEHLQPRHCLLLVDTCEAAGAAARALLARLLASCPHLRVVAIGRAPLGVPGEVPWHVDPLGQAEATALLATRVGAAGDGRAGGLARLAGRLAGLPVALELAVPRLRSLPAAVLADLLTAPGADPDAILAAGPGADQEAILAAAPGADPEAILAADSGCQDASGAAPPARQGSLSANLAWSYRLLTPPVARLLRWLSAWPGAIDLAAVEWLAAGWLDRGAACAAIADLVDAALVEVDLTATTASYRMLDPIRWPVHRLAVRHGDADVVRARYQHWQRQPAWVPTLQPLGEPAAAG